MNIRHRRSHRRHCRLMRSPSCPTWRCILLGDHLSAFFALCMSWHTRYARFVDDVDKENHQMETLRTPTSESMR